MASFVFLVETGFLHVGQAGLELLTSGDPPTSVSQNAGHESPCLAMNSFIGKLVNLYIAETDFVIIPTNPIKFMVSLYKTHKD